MSVAFTEDLARPDLGESDAVDIRTSHPSLARSRTIEFLGCGHAMTVDGDAEDFDAAVSWRRVGEVGVLRSRYRAPVTVTCTPPIPWVTISFVPRGAVSFAAAGRSTTGDRGRGVVLDYGERVDMRWGPATEQFMVAVGRDRLERGLRTLVEDVPDAPLVFEPGLEVDGAGHAVVGAVASLRALLAHSSGPPPAVLTGEVEHAVVTALLLGTRHNHRERIFRRSPPAPPRVLRRVLELVESAHDRTLTVADLAAHAGTSERALHAAFRRELGTTPMAYLRGQRLEAAREDLLTAEPGEGVAAIAMRHGFAHLGRFAAAYRARFGEAPSTTLRR
ncbi:AraC family transcriptional regulator [Actinomycetospora lemnae]|uniref:AraC family transcriptional regulator n=1 Tax=Actinomycetospora lemnae TaxID=3019891 RepID=A0ABT5SME5_9PSEU|nr:AraC family transcriptional regulator [Actinomycetospora sp. DW7H6]MDD7964017.1 AraC family transcriptional regulator [Actinomycetospora sp. DW7H6]